ncbi:MAG: hypothetical protein ACLFPX_04815 [Candidatus Omnitrophota bacterium]
MNDQPKSIDVLNSEVKKIFHPFVNQYVKDFGEDLQAIYIYGEAADPEFSFKHGLVTAVLFLADTSPESLEKSLKTVARGQRKGIAAPLCLTEEWARSSMDVFPLEFLEMKQSGVCVYGRDVLADLAPRTEHLRLFCEQQIKGKALRIQQAYLEVGRRRHGVESLLKDSLKALIPVFRAILFLRGKQFGYDREKILTDLCDEFSLSKETLLGIYEDAVHDDRIKGEDAFVVLSEYLRQLNILADQVDRL